jgi:hypothetical protein
MKRFTVISPLCELPVDHHLLDDSSWWNPQPRSKDPGNEVRNPSLFQFLKIGRFAVHNCFLKLSHATCLQLELYCVNQEAHKSQLTYNNVQLKL